MNNKLFCIVCGIITMICITCMLYISIDYSNKLTDNKVELNRVKSQLKDYKNYVYITESIIQFGIPYQTKYAYFDMNIRYNDAKAIIEIDSNIK